MPTAVGVFDNKADTEQAIDKLVQQGAEPEAVGVIWREQSVRKTEEVEVTVYVDHFEDPLTEAKKGAVGGAVGGSVAGVGGVILASAGVLITGPVGAVLAAGTLGAAAAAAAAGAVGGSITGGLIGALLGATDHDATKTRSIETKYRDAIERNGFVITIEADDDTIDMVIEALREAGADQVSRLSSSGDLRAVIDIEDG